MIVLEAFVKENGPGSQFRNEAQLSGSLSGFLTALVPSIKVIREHQLVADKPEHADLLVSGNSENLLVELKRSGNARAIEDGIKKLTRFMIRSGITQGIVFNYPRDGGDLIMHRLTIRAGDINHSLVVIAAPEHDAFIAKVAASHLQEIQEAT